jgi:LuxR family maltose regulon positive regulatory protein
MRLPKDANATMELLHEFTMQGGNPYYVMIARSCQARLLLMQGDRESAVRWMRTTDLTLDADIMCFWLEVPRLTQCRVLMAQDSSAALEEAADRLRAYWQTNQAQHNMCRMIEILLLQAQVAQKQGQRDDALLAVEQAVTLAQSGGWIRPFVELGPDMAKLLKRLNVQKNIAAEYISQLLDAFTHEELGVIPDVSAHTPPDPLSSENQALVDPLTKREIEILTLLAQRLSNREIAEKLFISPGTVKLYTIKIYQKLDVHSRREATVKANELGFLASSP